MAVLPAEALAKPKLEAGDKSQKAILDAGAIGVSAKGLDKKITVVAESKTFDSQGFEKLSKSVVLKPDDKSGKLQLKKKAKRAIASCQPRKIRLTAEGAEDDTFDLKRNSTKCDPPVLDLGRSGECDTITLEEDATPGEPACMLPFPDDFHTTEDYSSATGRRVAFQEGSMPENSGGTPIDPVPYAFNDGFSPGQTTVVRVPAPRHPRGLRFD